LHKIMSRVRSVDTTPEKIVRSLVQRLGFRFRLHRGDLPGKPDIVLKKYKIVIFVHGCFWHRHLGCPRASEPATHQDYWMPKFTRTSQRDARNQKELKERGWDVLVVWECELKSLDKLVNKLVNIICPGEFRFSLQGSNVPRAAEGHSSFENIVGEIIK
jgi:DNA mismatch endonuclease, patch repair protein